MRIEKQSVASIDDDFNIIGKRVGTTVVCLYVDTGSIFGSYYFYVTVVDRKIGQCNNNQHDWTTSYTYCLNEMHYETKECKKCGKIERKKEICSIVVDMEGSFATNRTAGTSEAVHCTKCEYSTLSKAIDRILNDYIYENDPYFLTSPEEAEWQINKIDGDNDTDYYIDNGIVKIDNNEVILCDSKGINKIEIIDKKNNSRAVYLHPRRSCFEIGTNIITITKSEKYKLPISFNENYDGKPYIISSSNNSIVSIDEDGNITGKRAGCANVNFRFLSQSYWRTIRVIVKDTGEEQTPPTDVTDKFEEEATTNITSQNISNAKTEAKKNIITGIKAKKVKNKKVSIKFNRIKIATKYEIQYATNKKFKNVKKKMIKSIKCDIKRTKKAKAYWIRIRAILKKSKGPWSKTIKISFVKQ